MRNLYTLFIFILFACSVGLNAQSNNRYSGLISQKHPNKGSILNTSNCENRAITFSTSGLESNIQSYLWDFGNGVTSNQASPVYTYTTTGDYVVTLTVQYYNGFSETVTKNLKIGKVPVPDFTASQTDGNFPYNVQFTNTTSGTVLTYLWSFGNYYTSSAVDPSYQYANATKDYDVTLTAISPEGCEASITKQGFIHVNSQPVHTVFIPNTFSPNNDGLNETFIVYGENIKSVKMSIYDQTGTMIFSQDGLEPLSKGWAGENMSNQEVASGKYSYKIVVVDEMDVSHESVGNVTLIR